MKFVVTLTYTVHVDQPSEEDAMIEARAIVEGDYFPENQPDLDDPEITVCTADTASGDQS